MKTLEQRYWSKVDRRGPGECWPWTGSTSDSGHGRIYRDGRPVVASRISWELEHGSKPTADVLHRCDNPPCMNPRHMFLGTQTDNIADATNKGRMAQGEAHYRAKLTLDDVHMIDAMFASGYRIFEIARYFDVGRMTITYVLRGDTWKSRWRPYVAITRSKRRLMWVHGEPTR